MLVGDILVECWEESVWLVFVEISLGFLLSGAWPAAVAGEVGGGVARRGVSALVAPARYVEPEGGR